MLDDLKVTRYDDDLEVVLDAAIAIDGEDGKGVLPGGLLGQILTKASATDFDTLWADPSAGVPNDGTAGQLLSKVSSDPYDTLWINPPAPDLSGYLPLTGGTTTGPVIMDHLHVNSYFMAHPDVTVMRDNTNYPTITAGSAQIHLVAGPPTTGNWAAQIHFKVRETGGGQRWLLGKQNDAESTGNAGSNFRLYAYDDAGVALGEVFKANRATQIMNFTKTPTAPTPTAGDSTTKLATTAFVTAAITAGGGAYLPLTGGTLSGALIVSAPVTTGALEILANNAHLNKAGAASSALFLISSDAGYQAAVYFRNSSTAQRWQLGKTSGAETGSNAGSDFSLIGYSDTNTNLGTYLSISRATKIAAFTASPTAPTPTAGDNSTKLATTAYVDTAVGVGGSYLPLAGGTLTGSVLVTGVNSTISIDKTGQAANASLNIYSDNNYSASLYFRTGAETRWALGRMATPTETGSGNTGSPFGFFAYDDDGNFLGNVFTVTRATQVVDFAATPTVLGVPLGGGGGGQPLDATLTALAALDATAGFVEQTGTDAFTKFAVTSAGKALLDDANNTAQRTTLGLGTSAIVNTGTSGATIPLLSTANTWTLGQTFTATATFNGIANFNHAGGITVTAGMIYINRTGDLADAQVTLAGDQGYNASVAFTSRGYWRWLIGKNTDAGDTAQSGPTAGAAGSNFYIQAWNDDQTTNSIALTINRATLITNFNVSPTAPTPTALDNSLKLATTAYVDAAVAIGGGGGGGVSLSVPNTWTALQSFTTASGLGLEVISTDLGATVGPIISLKRNSTTPAVDDVIAGVWFQGNDSTPTMQVYSSITSKIIDITPASFDAKLQLQTAVGSSVINILTLGPGVAVGTAVDQGVNTLNAGTLYENAVSLSAKYTQLAAANTFTAAQTISLALATSTNLTLLTTSDSGSPGPILDFTRVSASPAAGDDIGAIRFYGRNSAAASIQYSDIYTAIADPVAGVESSRVAFRNYVKGALTVNMMLDSGGGIYINEALFSYPSVGSSSTISRLAYNLAHFRGSGTAIGAIVFHAPNATTANMHRMRVFGYLHATTLQSIDFTVSGYHATIGGSWANMEVQHFGTNRPMVRFGVDAAGFQCLIVGDVATSWNAWPNLAITEALISHTGAVDSYTQGWTVSLETSLSAYTVVSADLTLTDKGAVQLDGTGGATLTGALTAASLTTTGNIITTSGFVQINRATDAADAVLYMDSDTGSNSSFELRTGASRRWIFGKSGTAESGANVGSNFYLTAYSDTATLLGIAFTVARADQVLTFTKSPIAPTPTALDNSTKLATTAYVDALYNTANTFTLGQTINMGDTLPSTCLTLTSTWGSAAAGPFLYLSRLSPDPAALDEIGQISFIGKDSGLVDTTYASIGVVIVDPTNSSEDSKLRIRTLVNAVTTTIATFDAGILVGTSTGGDKGANTLNANTLYEAGVTLASKYETLGVVAGINTQTASYTLVLADAGKVVEVNNASANTLTVPPNSTAAFPLNTRIDVSQLGAGQTTITAGAGVTIRQREAKLKLTGQYAGASLYKRGTDEWVLFGDVSA